MSGDSAMTDGVNSRNSDTRKSVTVNVRHASNDAKYSVQASLKGSVEALKSAIEWKSDILAGHQQLMYKGRDLQDAHSLKSYGLEAGDTVELVYGSFEGEGWPFGPSQFTEMNFMNQLYLDMCHKLTHSSFMMKEIMNLPIVQFEMVGNQQLLELQQHTDNPSKMQQVLDLPDVKNLLICKQDVLIKDDEG